MPKVVRRLADVRERKWFPDRMSHKSIVMLDGVDISKHCFRAVEYFDGSLEAFVYVTDDKGLYTVQDNEVLTKRLTGRGSIEDI
jgi:hypothetical protein